MLNLAKDFDEHAEQLREAFSGDGAGERNAERRRRFLESFVRPNGVDRPAAPFLAEAITGAAAGPRPKPRRLRWQVVLRPLLLPFLGRIRWRPKVPIPPKSKRKPHERWRHAPGRLLGQGFSLLMAKVTPGGRR
jgi:hypothetical protein